MQRLANPYPLFLDARGALLDGGYVVIGTANGDPELSPASVYWDAALTIPADQPLRTLGGHIVNGSSRAFVYINADDYSLRIRDSDSSLVEYIPSAVQAGNTVSYQPLDTDLTAIGDQGTTAFGRSLLALTSSGALKDAAGVTDGLPTTGGPLTGNIYRSGAGAYIHFADAAFTQGRIFIAPASGADPTSLPGDIWIKT